MTRFKDIAATVGFIIGIVLLVVLLGYAFPMSATPCDKAMPGEPCTKIEGS